MIRAYLVIACFICLQLSAQHSVDYTQYMFNALLFNPAYAGSSEALDMVALYRRQWSGLTGAPQNMAFAAHTQFSKKSLNAGFITQNESIGIFNRTLAAGIYAYRFPLGAGYLALGMQAGVLCVNNNWTAVRTIEKHDPGISAFNERRVLPSFAAGLYFHSAKAYAGAALPELNGFSGNRGRTFQLHGGYLLDADDAIKLKPAIILRYIKGSPLAVNAALFTYYRELIGLGFAYTHKTTLSIISDIKVNDQFRAGYAYTYALNEWSAYSGHELMLRYIFSYRMKAPSSRYF